MSALAALWTSALPRWPLGEEAALYCEVAKALAAPRLHRLKAKNAHPAHEKIEKKENAMAPCMLLAVPAGGDVVCPHALDK